HRLPHHPRGEPLQHERHPRRGGRDRLHDQRGERLPDYRPDAEDVPEARAAAMNDEHLMGAAFAFTQLSYVLAAALFVLSLKWLSAPETARRGVWAGEIGM